MNKIELFRKMSAIGFEYNGEIDSTEWMDIKSECITLTHVDFEKKINIVEFYSSLDYFKIFKVKIYRDNCDLFAKVNEEFYIKGEVEEILADSPVSGFIYNDLEDKGHERKEFNEILKIIQEENNDNN